VGKITEKAVCRSVCLTIWHCILSAELPKRHSFRLFLAILLTGIEAKILCKVVKASVTLRRIVYFLLISVDLKLFQHYLNKCEYTKHC